MDSSAFAQAFSVLIVGVVIITVVVTLLVVFGGGWLFDHVRIVIQ